MNLILMTGPDCSLCIEAERRIHQALGGTEYRLQHRDITGSLELKKRYGLRIPVLVLETTPQRRELFWPFDVTDVKNFTFDHGSQSHAR